MCIASIGQTGRYFVEVQVGIPISSISGVSSRGAAGSTVSSISLTGPVGFFLNTLAVVTCLSWSDLWQIAFNAGTDLDKMGIKPENFPPVKAGVTSLSTTYSRYKLSNVNLLFPDFLPGEGDEFHEEKLNYIYITGKEVPKGRFYPYLGMDILSKFDLTRLPKLSGRETYERLVKLQAA